MSKKKPRPSNWQQRDPDYGREAEKYPRPVPSRRYLQQVLEGATGPLTIDDLLEQFQLETPSECEALVRRIAVMVRSGELVQNRRGALGPAKHMHTMAGVVQGHRDGFGFLIPDAGGEDIYLSARQMQMLLHGDRALVRITGNDARGRAEGSVVDVLERRTTRVAGRYRRQHGVGVVIPDNTRITQEILVPEGDNGGAKHGQIVTVELIRQPGRMQSPVGRIVEVLGEARGPGMEIEIALRSHNLPYQWPEGVEAQAEAFGIQVSEAMTEGRKDLRELPFITIDGEDARDFDDAVCAERVADGWRLWVAIADVAAYVEPSTALDNEAKERGNSVYFPERVIPMLPEALSNGLCSLNPQVDRLCLVCEMRVDAVGKVSAARFHNAVMHSRARLTYTKVAAVLADSSCAADWGMAELLPQLGQLQAVYQALLQARNQRGAINFETTETKIVFNAERKIDRIVPVVRNDAHCLIEECMIAANVQAARFLAKHKMPQLFRIHDGPASEKLRMLREFLGLHGVQLGGGAKPRPADYARVVQQIGERPDARLLQTVLLRSLAQAVYAPDNIGHFGLALEYYGHFTSPIRRYPDLLTHRAIKHVLAGGKAENFRYSANDLRELGVHCSMTERRADDATRDVVNWLKCEYMQDRIGDTFDGIITSVVPFGLFVELKEIYVEGLVHVSNLRNDYYHHDASAECLRGERSGVTYRLSDPVRVKVLRVNLDERKIDFELIDETPAQPAKRSFQRRKR